MCKGKCYWITGLANSGKTTIGTALYYELRKEGNNTIILDGDLMKQITSGSENIGYSSNERLLRAKRYSLMAKLLADQGFIVIVCAIAMYDVIREWNRKNIKGYIEIYLKVSDEVLVARDKRGVFEWSEDMQLPKFPDLVVNNDGNNPIREIVKEIKRLKPINYDDYDRDRDYWNNYYKEIKGGTVNPSDFAIYIAKKLNPGSHILELGCGNGRDSLYFIENGHNVVAIDGSDYAIGMLNDITKEKDNALFICDDFVKCRTIYQMMYDCIYSRFTLHAITEDQENELLTNVREGLSNEGLLCIEARTIHDEIYGMGERVGHNAFMYNGHFRRFIDVDEFREKILSMGFDIITIQEKTGFSKTVNSDPMLMRCLARKKVIPNEKTN